jgi:preprotein translocase subunit SecB
MAEEQAAAQEQASQQQFVTQRIYTKDISFESPATPNVFRQEWKPNVNVDLNTKSSRLDDEGNHEVVLTLTITAKLEEQTAFLVEVQQAAIFFVSGIEGEALRQLLSTVAPTILFPYAREAIDSLVVRGGFPALMIAPVNFDALYRQAVAQQAADDTETDAAPEGATH